MPLKHLTVLSFFLWIYSSAVSVADCKKSFSSLRASQPQKLEARVKTLFQRHFHENYRRDECFENSVAFLEKVQSLSSRSFYLVSIENRGASTLGMVSAKKARGIEFEKENGEWEEVPASVETKWGHHVFVMDDAFMIYDFDYTHQPKVVSLKTYLKTMYLDEPADLRQKKLEDYQVVLTQASYAIKKQTDPKQRKMSLQDFWNLK